MKNRRIQPEQTENAESFPCFLWGLLFAPKIPRTTNHKNKIIMKTKHIQIITLAATTAAAAVLMTGCGTTAGYKQADKTGAGIAEFREEIVNGKAAIDNTVTALDQIAATATTNPREAFGQYSKAVDNLDSAANKAKKQAQDMREKGQAYFKQWEAEMAQVKNPEIRQLAEQQKAKLQETFESIRKYSEPLKAQFDPWLSDLKDLRTYLGNDLTISGVNAAKSLFAKTRAEGAEVQKSMDGLIAELNTIAATITPAKVESKK